LGDDENGKYKQEGKLIQEFGSVCSR